MSAHGCWDCACGVIKTGNATNPKGWAFDNLSRFIVSHRTGITVALCSSRGSLERPREKRIWHLGQPCAASLDVTCSGIKCVLPVAFCREIPIYGCSLVSAESVAVHVRHLFEARIFPCTNVGFMRDLIHVYAVGQDSARSRTRELGCDRAR